MLLRYLKRKKYERETNRHVRMLFSGPLKVCPWCEQPMILTGDRHHPIYTYGYYCSNPECDLHNYIANDNASAMSCIDAYIHKRDLAGCHLYYGTTPIEALKSIAYAYMNLREDQWIAKYGYKASETCSYRGPDTGA